MSEFGRGSGGPVPTEGRREVEREHEKDLRELAERAHEAERARPRSWWKRLFRSSGRGS